MGKDICQYLLCLKIISQSIATMDHFLRDMFCGTLSGVGNCISGYIFDTLKVRMQMDHTLTMTASLKSIIQKQGFMHLFNGIYYPLITIPLVNAIIFSAYELYKKMTKKTELSFINGIQNGAFAGLVNTIVVSPVQLVKCRMQLDKDSKYPSSSACAKEILKNQGIRGLFRGTYSTAFRQICAYSAQFAAYEFLKQKILTKQHKSLSFLQGMLVGTFAGINCWIFSYPQDIIKTMLQVSQKGTFKTNKWLFDGGFFNCGKYIYSKYGFGGFWIGIQPCLIRAAVANAFGIGIYEQSQRMFYHMHKQA